MDADLKKLTDGLIANLSGMTAYVQKSLEKSLEELKKNDSVTGAEKAKEYAEALKSAKVADSFKDLNEKINQLRQTK